MKRAIGENNPHLVDLFGKLFLVHLENAQL